MAKSFSKVSERAALKPRRDPHWTRLQKGCYLGFRKMAKGASGTWLARFENEALGKRSYETLGDFSDLPDNERFDAASKAAESWFTHLGKGGSTEDCTVRRACQRYVENMRDRKGDKVANDTDLRFTRWVYDDSKLASIALDKLTHANMQDWRTKLKAAPVLIGKGKKQVKRKRSDSSINRDMTTFRAALNLAFLDGLVTSDHAWRRALAPLKNADTRRDVYLDINDRRKLIEHAREDISDFLRGLSLLPLRPGALAQLTVGDFDTRLKTLSIRDKGNTSRKLSLPDATAQFFVKHAKGKLSSAALIARADGNFWDKDSWKYPIKDAAAEAGLSNEVTAYVLRHSAITDLIHGGLDTLTVAQISGTSVAMIERHYGHLTKKHAQAALAMLVL